MIATFGGFGNGLRVVHRKGTVALGLSKQEAFPTEHQDVCAGSSNL